MVLVSQWNTGVGEEDGLLCVMVEPGNPHHSRPSSRFIVRTNVCFQSSSAMCGKKINVLPHDESPRHLVVS